MRAILPSGRFRHAPGSSIVRGIEMPLLEQPARVEALAAAVRQAGLEVATPRDFGLGPIRAVHSEDYLEFLGTIYARWQELRANGIAASETVQSSGFTLRDRHARVPKAVSAQVDYYLAGGWAPIDADTYEAALESAHCALEGAEDILGGARHAFALCRPPGHHAYADLAGGFCYLNNVAIAARHLVRQLGRVAILDVDAHHGNGTQAIFYDRADVFFASIHADPSIAYPYYCGFADEVGTGAGLNHNLNLPLPRGAGDETFLAALDTAIASLRAYRPKALLVSLGLDGFAGDPTKLLEVTSLGFHLAGAAIAGLGVPTLVVQEGGYDIASLGDNLRRFLDGLNGERFEGEA